jgi:hypothetical protein
MWVIMPTGGFLSAVRKPEDEGVGTLTIRARVKADLIELRENFLPALGPIQAGGGTDYGFRASAKADDFAEAMAAMARAVTYSNFKDEVARVKGSGRARTYHTIWSVLLKLQQRA